MSQRDVIIVGGGISGASFAFHAARDGRDVLVLDAGERPGGCLHSERKPTGFWYELGAHTCYNSYGSFLELLEGCGLIDRLQPRGKSVLRFLDGDSVVAGQNLLLLVKLFSKLELAAALPRWIGASKESATVRSYYSRLVGAKNYERVLGPMLSAVPSQQADDFPADMLFKKRDRRKDVIRSFTLASGLMSVIDAIASSTGIEMQSSAEVSSIERSGDAFAVRCTDGEEHTADVLALAVPPQVCGTLLADVSPDAAAAAGRVRQVQVDSLGVAVRKDLVHLPYATFFIPLSDAFHSVVTRDVVPDDEWRGFVFHFRPGLTREQRTQRVAEVLGVDRMQMDHVAERRAVLPSPTLGHPAIVDTIDRQLVGKPLAVTGNWFGGLSIEDCVLRSRAEWQRLASL